MRPFSKKNNKNGLKIISLIRGYNHEKYWKRRAIVVDPNNKTPTIIKLYYLFYIKKKDFKFGCSFGTNLNQGARFETPPILPHGPYGIICGHNWEIGKNCTIYHQVTLAGNGSIGDNCLIGAGAKILNNVSIGNNVKIGLNAVVIEDIPDNSTVVLPRPRILNNQR